MASKIPYEEDSEDQDLEEAYDSLFYSHKYNEYLKKKKKCLDVSLCDIVYGYTFSGDKWLNSVLRDKNKVITFDEEDNDHPYVGMLSRIKEIMAETGIHKDEITDNLALYELSIILNNIILSAPTLTNNLVLYRGECTYKDDLMSYNIDDIYINEGIWSTSLDPYVAYRFAKKSGYVISILVTSILDDGKPAKILPIKDCTMEENEFEILLPSGCTFLIVNKVIDKPKALDEITLRMLDQPSKEHNICSK